MIIEKNKLNEGASGLLQISKRPFYKEALKQYPVFKKIVDLVAKGPEGITLSEAVILKNGDPSVMVSGPLGKIGTPILQNNTNTKNQWNLMIPHGTASTRLTGTSIPKIFEVYTYMGYLFNQLQSLDLTGLPTNDFLLKGE